MQHIDALSRQAPLNVRQHAIFKDTQDGPKAL
jgi:hypothetical protein